ncbi:hypothetical protein ACYJW8_15385 [Frateuria aurantia]
MAAVFFRRCLWLASGLLLGGQASARVHHPAPKPAPDTMTVQIKNDRLTMLLVKFPQVYLAGPLDAGAPERLQQLLQKGQVPDGSDVYLDSATGDMDAGLALGRLFRSHHLVTHVGARPPPGGHGMAAAARTASCVDACTYAYFGGLYRWAPSGTDRIGLHQAVLPQSRPALADYLGEMGLNRRQLQGVMRSPQQDMVWFDTGQMLPWLVANNGRLPLTASYQLTPAGPQLTYLQTAREGRHRVLLRCARDGASMTAVDELGERRILNVWPRIGSTYFEINHQAIAGPPGPVARRVGDGLQFERPLDIEQVRQILGTESLGAWMRDRNGAVRYGFTIGPIAVRDSTQFFFDACRHELDSRLGGTATGSR